MGEYWNVTFTRLLRNFAKGQENKTKTKTNQQGRAKTFQEVLIHNGNLALPQYH